MCKEEVSTMIESERRQSHLDIREDMRKQFRWMLVLLASLVIPLAGGMGAVALNQQRDIGHTNERLATLTETLTDSVERQNKMENWAESRRSEYADILLLITQNQMKMTEKLHKHELNGEHK